MAFERPQDVANDLEKLLELDEGYDVIIYAGENENVQEIRAHSIILRVRSQYFHSLFSENQYEANDGKAIFRKPNISPKLFKMILRFIYCGKINLEKLQGSDVLKLSILVNEFKIQALTHLIQEYLIKHHSQFLQQNPTEILETIYQHESFTDLWNYCLEEICARPDILFKSDKFVNLKAPLLELLLKRDDLSLEEIDIWDNLIKWCLAQHSNISQEPTQWNNEEITIIERTIHGFIPLIRFHYISSESFVIKVYPFRKIIPDDLISNLLIFYMAPNKQLNDDKRPFRQSKCDSIIVKHDHIKIFAKWIDRKGEISTFIPYRFKLLYRASINGNTSGAFHAKCDNKGATLVVIKMENSNQIAGGYNPVSWDTTSNWRSTGDSFIYLFTDRNNLNSANVSYSNGDAYSIGCNADKGPVFGGGKDLYIRNGIWYSEKVRSYPRLGLPRNFTADDYEVFQVIKR
ncbi:hypothetical protein RclHR1_16090003 [Rhizophagus clarus]|uniref:BTB domain-containing protein n=1 Tax=Rhizophagus clarus TaxID=94130 RepID=A0A2Z6R9J2_9GLOM|nr:hypothetical protein RclHR1_16090003 [Rhizophagus clarus]GES85022.1 hypothetical protein GLOIN_2v1769234 [Rhizophagus clarus]